MNALNVSPRALTVTTVRPPLVVALSRGFAWIERGHGFTLTTSAGQWVPLVDADGLGGRVMAADEVAALVATYGRPVLP